MAMKKQSYFLSASVAVCVVAGCAAPQVLKPAVETNTTPHLNTSTQPAQPQLAQPGAAQTNPMAADPNKNVDSANDNALDNSVSMHISAKDGGRYQSADGLLSATFPPGSLSEDTDVKLVRVDTKDLKNSDVFLNGIRYQWDL